MSALDRKEVRMTHNLIANDRVKGTPVCRASGEKIGVIQRLMIDKLSGKVAYAAEIRWVPRILRQAFSSAVGLAEIQP